MAQSARTWESTPAIKDTSNGMIVRVLSNYYTLQWRHNGRDGVSNHQPHDCLLNRLFGRRSKKTSNLRVTGLCAGNSPVTGEFPAQMASNAENVSIWWRHHDLARNKALPCLRWKNSYDQSHRHIHHLPQYDLSAIFSLVQWHLQYVL